MPTRLTRLFAAAALLTPVFAINAASTAQDAPATAEATQEIKVLSLEEMQRQEIERLKAEGQWLREMLAKARLEASQAARERDELRQFIAEHAQLGADFEKYKAFLDMKERELRRQRAEEAREKQKQEAAERLAKAEAARAERAAKLAKQQELRRYEREGFYPIGQGVFVSGMAYQYKRETVPDYSYRFTPLIQFDGTWFFHRYWYVDYDEEVDWSEMTVSGSVLNASDEPRDIGIAISFFDRRGNHVGGTTIEVQKARKDAPYPFTKVLDMALDGPFYSYRINVLYADPVDGDSSDTKGQSAPMVTVETTLQAPAAAAAEAGEAAMPGQ